MTVYVLREKSKPELFKVGKAEDPQQRLRQLRTAEPDLYIYKLCDGFDSSHDSFLEKHFHVCLNYLNRGFLSSAKECFTLEEAELSSLDEETCTQYLDSLISNILKEAELYFPVKEKAEKVSKLTELTPEIRKTDEIERLYES